MIFNRKTMIIPLLVAAVGIPYAVRGDGDGSMVNSISKMFSTNDDGSENNPFLNNDDFANNGELTSVSQNGLPPGVEIIDTDSIAYAPAIQDFRTLFRFDVTQNWIRSTWPRASARNLGKLVGLRVPLVSGPSQDDLIGSLTYYFDERNVVARIEFDGYTVDPNKTMQHLVHFHGVTPDLYFGSQWYTRRTKSNEVLSVLKIDYKRPNFQMPKSQKQIHLMFELNNPASKVGLSAGLQKELYDIHLRKTNGLLK